MKPLSAFEFDEHGQPAIEMVATVDSDVVHTANFISIKRGRGERLVGYFKVDPRRADANLCRYLIIEYRDRGTGYWLAEYDRSHGNVTGSYPWTASEKMLLSDSGRWRRIALRLHNPRWTGSINNADFRIVVVNHTAAEFTIRSLMLAPDPGDAEILLDGSATHDDFEQSPAARNTGFVKPSDGLPLRLPAPDNASVSIVIPVFNRLAYTRDCLHAIMEFTPPVYEVIVVDDGSTDGSGQYLSGVPGLRLLPQGENRGFAKACNTGAAAARGEWLLFLNNDTVPQPGWLTSMVAAAERDPAIAVVGSKLIYPQTGTIQHAGVAFSHARLPRHEFEHLDAADPAVSVDREVDAVTGACLLTPRGTFQLLGGFDERFLNGYEDIDYCLRVRLRGEKVLFCSRSILLHYKSVSPGRLDVESNDRNVELFRQEWDEFIVENIGGDRPRLSPGRLPYRLTLHPDVIASQTGEVGHGAVTCRAAKHTSGHCVYGGFLEVSEPLTARAVFLLEVPNPTAGGRAIATFDVYDCVNNAILAYGVLKDQTMGPVRGRCVVEFRADAGQILEFRIFWHGDCDLVVSAIDVISADEPHAD